VKEIDVADGVVRVALDLPEDHQFASNIRHEILEKLEHRWDVEEVVIDFLGEED
jgi:nitrogen fixation NifU-like protein